MLRLSEFFHGLDIHSLQTGRPVGQLIEPIINPDNLAIPAWHCQRFGEPGLLILHSDDIREVGQPGVIIDNEERMMTTEDLVRLQAILDLKFDLVGKKVVTANGQRVGRVSDYVINEQTWLVQKLHVSQSPWRNVSMGNRIIDRAQIVEVTPKKIIVRNTEVKAGKTAHVIAFNPLSQGPA